MPVFTSCNGVIEEARPCIAYLSQVDIAVRRDKRFRNYISWNTGILPHMAEYTHAYIPQSCWYFASVKVDILYWPISLTHGEVFDIPDTSAFDIALSWVHTDYSIKKKAEGVK